MQLGTMTHLWPKVEKYQYSYPKAAAYDNTGHTGYSVQISDSFRNNPVINYAITLEVKSCANRSLSCRL